MRILLAIDGSPSSYAAVAEVSRRPWPKDSEIQVITVDPPCDASPLRTSGSTTAFDDLVKAQRAESIKHLQNAVAILAQSVPDCRVTSALIEGSPKDAIVSTATDWGADLIVVGSHGYGPIRRFFLGSVSLYIASNAPCSVQIVRGNLSASSDVAASST